jgi:hypothetical protein
MRRQTWKFLEAAEFCRIWIPHFSSLAKPLYKAIKGGERQPLMWECKQQQAFHAFMAVLVSAPALGLPDVRKPFFLYLHERCNMAIGVLIQYLGSSFQVIGLSGNGMTSLPVRSHSHSLASIRGRKANTERGNNCSGATICCDFNGI